MKKILAILIVFLFVPFTAEAQDFCEGNFDYDPDQDGSDAFIFKTDFGRSVFGNPCPTDGPAPVSITGQSTSYYEGDDGDLARGVALSIPRYTDNGDGTVTDNLTGLMWLKDANCLGTYYPEFDNDGESGDGEVSWHHALDFVAGINDGTHQDCGAGYADWRLANLFELESLRDVSYSFPCLSDSTGTSQGTEGDPFFNVLQDFWSSTTVSFSPTSAWMVSITSCGGGFATKDTIFGQVWPVRGGH